MLPANLPPGSEAGAPAPEAWGADRARTRDADVLVLDARDPAAFAAGHLAGAGRLALEEFEPHRAELPPRDAAVLVVHDEPARAREAADTLAAMGYVRATWLDAPLAALPGGLEARGAATRLWRPSPFLARVQPMLPAGRVLDLACGSGRELVWLAERGWRGEGWDRAPEALERARSLAHRAGVEIATRVVDLEWRSLPEPEPVWNVVMVFRFLHRPLFPWIERLLAPGGVIVYETYRVGQERFGRPKHPRFLLDPGELAGAFPTCEVELHEESTPEHGPIMARVLARRRP